MDPELKSLLKENLKISMETNEILRKMHSAQKWARFLRLLYWLVIIGISVGVYYYLQEPLQGLISTYKGLMDSAGKIQGTANSLPNIGDINALIEKFGQ